MRNMKPSDLLILLKNMCGFYILRIFFFLSKFDWCRFCFLGSQVGVTIALNKANKPSPLSLSPSCFKLTFAPYADPFVCHCTPTDYRAPAYITITRTIMEKKRKEKKRHNSQSGLDEPFIYWWSTFFFLNICDFSMRKLISQDPYSSFIATGYSIHAGTL